MLKVCRDSKVATHADTDDGLEKKVTSRLGVEYQMVTNGHGGQSKACKEIQYPWRDRRDVESQTEAASGQASSMTMIASEAHCQASQNESKSAAHSNLSSRGNHRKYHTEAFWPSGPNTLQQLEQEEAYTY